jgi:LTXXQ motif family protein
MRQTVMRLWALPIVGAVALSLAIPSAAQARLRFGPGAVLGAFAGAVFGGFHYAGRHHHRRAVMHASAGPRNGARFDRRAADARRSVAAVPQPPANPPQAPQEISAQRAPERMAATFWPDAAADLADYVLLPSGNSRFWTYGYDSIVEAAFAGSDAADQGGARARAAAPRLSDAGTPNTPVASADLCGATSASADQFIEKINRAVEPNGSQRDALEELRGALARAIERIATSCPAAMPVSLAQRLKAIQDRIWAMHDALLTIRLPFERFYDALSEEQRQRLRGEAPPPAVVAANATEGRGHGTVDGRGEICVEPSAGVADWMMRAIERAAPGEQQRGVEAMRMQSAAMARLVAASCPSDPRPGAMGRVAAATDRLDVMLFAVMSVSPMLQQFYDSLDDRQKAGLARALRQARRSGAIGGRS